SADRGVLIVTGTKLQKFKSFTVKNLGGAELGSAEVAANLKTFLLLRLPPGLAAGDYQLVFDDRKGTVIPTAFSFRSAYRRSDARNITVNSSAGPSLVGIATTTDENEFAVGVTGIINGSQGMG